jgi:putative heme-binding domain-containing protein
VDVHGGFTAAAGSALYTARAYPEEYWNRAALVTEPTGNLLHQCFIEADGTSFVTHDGWNLLASDDEWTSPIIAEVGPDGAIWVVDWYNYIVQHNPTPRSFETGSGGAYITDLRDKTHGRIYRLAHESGGGDAGLNLDGATPDAIVAALGHDNMFWRLTAQRMLVERADTDVVSGLVALLDDQELDEIGNSPGALHGLATLDGLGVFDGPSVEGNRILDIALGHAAPAVRRRALAIGPRVGLPTEDYVAHLADGEPHVRLAALLALSDGTSGDDAGSDLARLVRDSEAMEDRWIPTGIIAAAAQYDESFLIALTEGDASDSESVREITHAVAEHYARGEDPDGLPRLLSALVNADDVVRGSMVAGLLAGWPDDRVLASSSDLDDALLGLAEQASGAELGTIATLARRVGRGDVLQERVGGLVQASLSTMSDADSTDEERIEAARSALTLGIGSEVREAALATLNHEASPALTAGIFDALAETESEEVATAILAHFNALLPVGRSAAIDTLLSRVNWADTFLDTVASGEIMVPTLSVLQRSRLATFPHRRIQRRAREIFSSNSSAVNSNREQLVEEMIHLATRSGDPAVGKQVFEENCASCHTFNGEGGDGAPVLTGVFGGNREEILIAIVDPNRSVEGNFRAWSVELEDGQILSGLVSDETKTSFTIQDTLGARHVILREDVRAMNMSSLSVMPEGFETMPEELMTGLLSYLTTTGSYQPLDMSAAANISSMRPMFHGEVNEDEPLQELMIFEEWGYFDFEGIPFQLIDPQVGDTDNFIMLYSPKSETVSERAKSVSVDCGSSATAIHLLSGVSGWGFPDTPDVTVTMIVRIHYADGSSEDHELINGEHFADYYYEVDVPQSKVAYIFEPHEYQMRYLSVMPRKRDEIARIEFVKGENETAPIVAAVTIETASGDH